MRIVLQACFLAPVATQAFLLSPEPKLVRHPVLDNIVESHDDLKLIINLDIGREDDVSRLAIRGLQVGLKNDFADYDQIAMPGVNGPHPDLSCGTRALDVLRRGEFVNQQGTQLVETLKGGWELVWNKDSPAGALLCGFEIPHDYTRNDAVLRRGRVYLSFPVWTEETLAYAQREKECILSRAQGYLDMKNGALEKYQAERNPLMKALHYREAFQAAEKYVMEPVKMVQQVPESDEVVKIGKICT